MYRDIFKIITKNYIWLDKLIFIIFLNSKIYSIWIVFYRLHSSVQPNRLRFCLNLKELKNEQEIVFFLNNLPKKTFTLSIFEKLSIFPDI